MRVLGNILWHIPFCGFLFALIYCIMGLLLCCTVILIPLGRGYFQMAKFMLAPFSYRMVSRRDLVWIGRSTDGTAMAAFSLVIRILYFPFGLLAALSAVGLIVGEAVTIVGIPSAIVWAKLFSSIFNPINKVCIDRDDAELIARLKADNRAANNGRLVPPGGGETESGTEEDWQRFFSVSFRNLKKAPLYMLPLLAVAGFIIFPLLIAGIGTIVVAVKETAYKLPLLLIGIGMVLETLVMPIGIVCQVVWGNGGTVTMIWAIMSLVALLVAAGGVMLWLSHRQKKTVLYGAILLFVGAVGTVVGGPMIGGLGMGAGLYFIIAQILSEKEGFEKLS